jgi:Lon-like ATP-dependent protease
MGLALSCPLRLLSVRLLCLDASYTHGFSSQSMPGKGGLQLTGKLGEVIRESAQIGLSWVKAHAYELGITKTPEEQFLTDRDIHVHMPEGSIGKEGPSAGTAILSAFVSLFTKTKIHPDIGTLYF